MDFPVDTDAPFWSCVDDGAEHELGRQAHEMALGVEGPADRLAAAGRRAVVAEPVDPELEDALGRELRERRDERSRPRRRHSA